MSPLFENLPSNHIQDSFQFGYPGFGMKKIKIDSSISEFFNQKITFKFFSLSTVRVFGSLGVRVLSIKQNTIFSDKGFNT